MVKPSLKASDVYSLGVLLCELLTEHRPAGGKLPPGLHGDLETIVRMAIREEPERRYASAGMLAEDIRRYIEGLPVSARKGRFAYRASKFARRHRTAILAGAAGLMIPVRLLLASHKSVVICPNWSTIRRTRPVLS